ncbi:rhombotarget A [Acinetobacter junii]|jgi:rhombotarget A family protien|uniref:Rhombosortase n=1 Tax=Acinetobacter junii CIP 107470 = MTCC 11364 TaxID=1217666 RepID=S7Y3D7_ACIJU|nr:rhombotarget A [Acinetobacter junii]APU48235.1 rhombotarget A [Acinetobacter junii]ENV49778.1 rhombotarget A [Acinetobacter junii CIP 107470 = MTCC 11364]EPR85684.1 Rhombosortase [Acinetobacter junii CIP 107470 = MTCC 11364]MCU4405906.1 rhombotarget A [Acinetobacter junii]MDH0667748.1 rhombotarget A [Acinetobacter junii]
MFKRTLACALFAITGHVYAADIQVTTLVDEDKDDTVCSLREAVFFLNNRAKKEYENGYHGCGNKDASSIILLQRDKEYSLNTSLELKVGMTITTATSGDFNDNKKGANNATLKMVGSDRIFFINDGSVEKELILVNLNELNLKGSATKLNDGGLIYNREALNIQYSRLTSGNATRGGGIYNAGILSDTEKTAGIVRIGNSILEGNKADKGAVIYSEMPRYLVFQSVIRDNQGTSAIDGAILFVQTGFRDETTGVALQSRFAGINNTTIFQNKGGYVANIREGMIVNNITMIKNAAGLYLQAPKWTSKTTTGETTTEEKFPSAFVSNSIIVDNGTTNCVTSSDDESVVQSTLTTSDCNLHAPAERPNFMWDKNNLKHKLIAGDSVEKDICDAPPADGLLCPFTTPKDQLVGFFKPRLLSSYSTLSDSLIVNKGRIYSDGSSIGLASCELIDQRGKNRSGYDELCDLGAIELVINRSEVPIAGQDILYGQIAKFNISESLLDGELLDSASCERILGKRSDGQTWQPGCLEVQQTLTPSKGKLTIDQFGNVVYTPNSNWHGADKFNLRIITTTTRFNDVSNYYITIPTTIVQDPPNNFESKTVNVSGGSLGLTSILMLLGLIGFRRFKA